MGLVTAFVAMAGLLGGLALLVIWAGFLERWVDGDDTGAATLDSLLDGDHKETVEPTPAPVVVSPEANEGSRADRFVFPPAA